MNDFGADKTMSNTQEQTAQAGQVERQVMHWYCFSYSGQDIETGQNASACTYVGYLKQGVTKAMIDANKKAAGVRSNAVLIAVSYLGQMTRDEFIEA